METPSGVNKVSQEMPNGSHVMNEETEEHGRESKKESRKNPRRKKRSGSVEIIKSDETKSEGINVIGTKENEELPINDKGGSTIDQVSDNAPLKNNKSRSGYKTRDNAKSALKKSQEKRKNKKIESVLAGEVVSSKNTYSKKQKKKLNVAKSKKSNEKLLVSVSPLEIALALEKIPALPPGNTPAKINKKCIPSTPLNKKNKDKSKQLRMLISVIPGEQVEVGIAENDVLLEYYLDMLHQEKLKGNIYKGIVHNIDINLQAAFVDFGSGKNGFLQIDEVHPEYWQNLYDINNEKKKLPPIQKVLKPGQELLVQVVKEPSGNKGAFLTTWLSLAGRFLVLTPGQEQIGVSRKVEEQGERSRLKDLIGGIDPGKGMGVIVRTAGAGATKTTLKNDLQYLKRLWKDVRKKGTEVAAPALIYKEPGLSERSVRDYLTDEITEIWVDNVAEEQNVRKTVEMLFPRKKDLVKLYKYDKCTLWENFKLVKQLEQIFSREVNLPSGGRLVFDQTEALMAIDINSGKISGKGNFEAMAFKTNMEASEIIAQQLRLRDIGGQIVIDFIEMKDKMHIQEVERNLRKAMKNDRARHDFSRISSFGLLELVRQRMGSSALAISMETCAACGGTGIRRNLEWQALQCLRELRYKLQSYSGNKLIYKVIPDLGLYLLNYKRESLNNLEKEFNKVLEIQLEN